MAKGTSRHSTKTVNTHAGAGPGHLPASDWYQGVIEDVNSDGTYVLRVPNHDPFPSARRVHFGPSDVELYPRGTHVLAYLGLSSGPIIAGVFKKSAETLRCLPLPSEAPGVDKVLGGDKSIISPSGNGISVLDGGVNIIHSAGNARITTHDDGYVEMLSGTFRHSSVFGETRITNNGGSINYSLRGGSNLNEHSGFAVVDGWTLRVDAGSEGDLLNVRVTDSRGRELAKHKLGSDGSVEVLARGGRLEQIFTSDTRVVSGESSLERTTVEGNSVREVVGTRTERLGALSRDVLGADKTTVGGNQSISVSGNQVSFVAGYEKKIVRGASIQEVYKDYQRVVAPVATGGVPSGQQMSWINYGGGFNFVMQPSAAGGTFNIVSYRDATVNLAVNGQADVDPTTGMHVVKPHPAAYSAVLYQPLKGFLDDLMTWLETHTHGSAVGPTSPPVARPQTTLSPKLPGFQSQRVGIGG